MMITKKIILILCCCIAISSVLPINIYAITIVEKNQLPALLSFDYGAALLGLEYGIDSTNPDLTATGTITESGFSWTGGGNYLSNTVTWTVAGTYDTVNDSLHWTGTGNYLSETWSIFGDIQWLSSTDFEVAHQYWIGTIGENGVETDGSDAGTTTIIPTSKITHEIIYSKTRRHKLLGTKGYVDKVTVTVDGGIITENKLEIHEGKKVVGVNIVNKSGTITLEGGAFTKTVKVKPIPEPATVLLLSIGGITLLKKRRFHLDKY